jgi:hypothetical protein
MTIVASYSARTNQPAAIFAWGLIAATTVPFISVAASSTFSGAVAVALVLLLIASGHVLATGYLMVDADVRRFLSAYPIKMIVMPLALMVGALLFFSQAGGTTLATAFALFFVYQAWHFGAQNIGVAAFISLSDRGRPLAPFEKNTIRCGIVAGMFGVLQAMWSVTLDPLGPAGIVGAQFAYELGAAMSIPLVGVAIWMMIRAFRDRHYRFGVAIALSICFLFPMYVTHNYLLGYVSITIAHGLQYMIFLFTHAASPRLKSKDLRIAKYGGPALIVAIVILANFIWNTDQVKHLPTIGPAIIPALTLPHFWVDLFLWRMKDRERAAWIKARFGPVIRPAAGQVQLQRGVSSA